MPFLDRGFHRKGKVFSSTPSMAEAVLQPGLQKKGGLWSRAAIKTQCDVREKETQAVSTPELLGSPVTMVEPQQAGASALHRQGSERIFILSHLPPS